MPHFEQRLILPVPPETLFAYHERPGAFERLNPPWQPVTVLEHIGGIRDGARVTIRVPLVPILPEPIRSLVSFRWHLTHQNYIHGKKFEDVQVRGPFSSWQHTHKILPHQEGSELIDSISYALPGGPLGTVVDRLQFSSQLKRLFNYRHAVTRNDLAVIERYRSTFSAKKILISGASGLVGTALGAFLGVAGHTVVRLVRRAPRSADEIYWNPDTGELNPSSVEGFDGWVNLSGENVAGGRWTERFKEQLFTSRVNTTGLLARTMKQLSAPPKVFVSASAIGYYGNRGSELLTEESPWGQDYLADLARRWEDEALVVNDITRVVLPRIGLVLSARGGALAKMLPPFLAGVGGVVGSGQQYMSWISLDDMVYALYHALATEALSGPVNFVTGEPATNREFTQTLGKVLHRPTLLPLPAAAVRLIFGEMGDRLLLGSLRVSGEKLRRSGNRAKHNTLSEALTHVVGR